MTIAFHCKGCGAIAFYFPEGMGSLAPGAVAHTKPLAQLGIRTSTGCMLYNACDPDEYWALHQHEPRLSGEVTFEKEHPYVDA